MTLPSQYDNNFQPVHREFIDNFIKQSISLIPFDGGSVLEVGPSTVHSNFSNTKFNIASFDIDPTVTATYHGDITVFNPEISDDSFDIVILSEVLEHTVNPFSAIEEVYRMLKDGGYVIVTVPLNARIHGPIPDCWRFTEFGLQVLFRNFDKIYFAKLDTPDRNLFPLHYGALFIKNKNLKKIAPQDLTFKPID